MATTTATASRTVSRRDVLVAGGVTAALASTVVLPGQASAAKTRTVTQRVAIKWRYNPSTRVTTVTRFRTRKVTARFTGQAVSLKSRAGTWTRVPYVWSRSKRALVYSRALHLRLLAAAAPSAGGTGGSGASQPTPTQPSGSTPTPSSPAPSATPSPSSSPTPSPDPDIATPGWTSVSSYVPAEAARHVLRRAGYGPTDGDLADVRRLGVAEWIDRQLDPGSIDDSACEAVLARLPDQSEDIWHVRDLIDTDRRSGWEQQMSVLSGHAVRALWSKRQLLTVMEDLWGNHFNVTCPGDNISDSRAHYAWTIRRHAFGRFADLLVAVTRHPSMLTYLNNRESDDQHPNENHGRELLELHTVGLEAGYTEAEVLDSARILTGLSVEWESGEYKYKPWLHWTGAVQVLSFRHPNATETGGEAVALAYLDALAHHPNTAQRVALKLARRFVSDEPTTDLVSRLAAVYTANDTRIAPVLRALFASPEFAASIGAKTWRPFEHVIATARLLGLQPDSAGVDGPEGLLWLAEDAGHNPFGAPFPTGYTDITAAWLSTSSVLNRWNATLNVAAGWWPTAFDRPTLRNHLVGATLPATHGDLVDVVSRSLFGVTLAPTHRSAALAFLGKNAGDALRADSGAITWRLPYLVAMLLDTPYQAMR